MIYTSLKMLLLENILRQKMGSMNKGNIIDLDIKNKTINIYWEIDSYFSKYTKKTILICFYLCLSVYINLLFPAYIWNTCTLCLKLDKMALNPLIVPWSLVQDSFPSPWSSRVPPASTPMNFSPNPGIERSPWFPKARNLGDHCLWFKNDATTTKINK